MSVDSCSVHSAHLNADHLQVLYPKGTFNNYRAISKPLLLKCGQIRSKNREPCAGIVVVTNG